MEAGGRRRSVHLRSGWDFTSARESRHRWIYGRGIRKVSKSMCVRRGKRRARGRAALRLAAAADPEKCASAAAAAAAACSLRQGRQARAIASMTSADCATQPTMPPCGVGWGKKGCGRPLHAMPTMRRCGTSLPRRWPPPGPLSPRFPSLRLRAIPSPSTHTHTYTHTYTRLRGHHLQHGGLEGGEVGLGRVAGQQALKAAVVGLPHRRLHAHLYSRPYTHTQFIRAHVFERAGREGGRTAAAVSGRGGSVARGSPRQQRRG